MGIEIIAIILFILFTIEIVYIFMYSGNNNPVQQNITSGGINLPPLPPPSSNLGVRTIRKNTPYVFDSDFDNGGIITSDIDDRRHRHRNRNKNRHRNNKHQHLTNIDFLVGDKKNTAIPVQSDPRFDDLDLSGKFNYDNHNPILTIGKIKNISKISDKINIKIDLD
jgi:hypothetical protein